ncbi:MAG TPA: class I SAM-dependent methyltransferase [Candidatus Acidoferrum sp.]|nr:class I SAM-dependent methyltransferase [Candidatus Acidoferrum sp.]
MSKANETMRRDWDDRARRDAFLYIASWRKDWDETSFFESGEQDYQKLVEPILQKLQYDPSTKSMAELGCGAGRMTRSFATHFAAVQAIDISSEMQSRAKQYLQSFQNIRWVLSDGETLAGVESQSVDFAFSYLVLQHMPEKKLVANSIRELMRILRPGGAFLFQFNGFDEATMNWKGRAISRVLDDLASLGLKKLSQRIAQFANIDPEMVGKTWRGPALTSGEIAAAVQAGNGSVEGFLDENTPLAWCYGRKQPEPAA